MPGVAGVLMGTTRSQLLKFLWLPGAATRDAGARFWNFMMARRCYLLRRHSLRSHTTHGVQSFAVIFVAIGFAGVRFAHT